MRLLALRLCLFAVSAHASSGGYTSVPASGCNGCHFLGTARVVTVASDDASPDPGQTVNLTITISTPNGAYAGFNLKASAGTLSTIDPNAKVVGAEVTQSAPAVENASGLVVFTARWTAPTAIGTYTLSAWGNSVNRGFGTNGDSSSLGTLSLCTNSTRARPLDDDCDG